jgi:CheY-like chemotaxis protein
MKVLVADDDIMSRYLTIKVLSDAGFQVVSAANGKEAWDILQSENPPRLVVLDWMMPVVDGVEVCRRIRENEMWQYTSTRWISVCGRPLEGVAGAVYEITTSLIPAMTAIDASLDIVAASYRPKDGKEASP